jgi:hypothetical protein
MACALVICAAACGTFCRIPTGLKSRIHDSSAVEGVAKGSILRRSHSAQSLLRYVETSTEMLESDDAMFKLYNRG